MCEYGLGRPLCGCRMQTQKNISWLAICRAYCNLENFQLYGCPICDVVPLLAKNPITELKASVLLTENQSEPDWEKICTSLCSKADGGSACNCDFPPF